MILYVIEKKIAYVYLRIINKKVCPTRMKSYFLKKIFLLNWRPSRLPLLNQRYNRQRKKGLRNWLPVDCLTSSGITFMPVQSGNKSTIATIGRSCNRGTPSWRLTWLKTYSSHMDALLWRDLITNRNIDINDYISISQ